MMALIPRMIGRISLFSMVALACDSGSSISEPPEQPIRTVQFRKLYETEVPPLPSGVAVTPDGRWIVGLGFQTHEIYLYDANNLDLVAGPVHSFPIEGVQGRDSLYVVQPHAAVISPDGSFVFVTDRPGVYLLSLPSLNLLSYEISTQQARYAIRDRAGMYYYFNGEDNDVFRWSAEDRSLATFQATSTEGIALTKDERELLALTDGGTRLKVLTTPDLKLVRSIDLPLYGVVVVPMKNTNKAIVFGGAGNAGQTAATMPLLAVPVDLDTGLLEPLQVLCCESPRGVTFLFGDGNQWTEVGQATAIIPTALGTLTADTETGAITLHPPAALDSALPPCCDITRFPDGRRIIISDFLTGNGPGRRVVYEVTETVAHSQ